jgi:hypothetical protein
MTELLFDTPFWLPLGLAALGVFVFWQGNRRRETGVRAAGAAVVALAAVLAAVSYVVDTPTERAAADARRLVQAVVGRDWTTVTSILDPGSSVSILNAGATVYTNRDQVVSGAQAAADRYDFKTARITGLDARRDDTVITVTITVFSEQGALPYPLRTEWQLEWEESTSSWKLVRITCLRIGDQTGESARGQFPRP